MATMNETPWIVMTDHERNVLVATEVTGWKRAGFWRRLRAYAGHPTNARGIDYPVFYSTHIAYAWTLLERLGLEWWPEVGRMDDGSWYCEICRRGDEPRDVGPPIRCVAPTAPEAICLAVLKVKGVEI